MNVSPRRAAACVGVRAAWCAAHRFDEESTGKITFRNLKKVAQELGEDLTDEELGEMLDEADRNGDGAIDQDEFFRVMKKRGDNPLDDLDSDED